MGIQGLAKLIADVAHTAVKESELKSYFGRKIAVDASMCLYQFLTAVRSEGAQLMSADGETTSHLMGTFYSNIRLIENGIKPIYVFDGKPPNLKSGELDKRAEKREEARKQLEKAEETGDLEAIDKFNKRLVKVTKQHVDECKQLLTLMGVPYIEAPGEAEAQCAQMVKQGLVWATATEDMDALTFGSDVLLRHITFSAARKIPVQEFHLNKVLASLELTKDELSWKEPDEDGLVKFLCAEKNFNEDRVRAGAKKLLKSRSTATQGRLDSFFKVIPSNNENAKRKSEENSSPANKKAKKKAVSGTFRGKPK